MPYWLDRLTLGKEEADRIRMHRYEFERHLRGFAPPTAWGPEARKAWEDQERMRKNSTSTPGRGGGVHSSE